MLTEKTSDITCFLLESYKNTRTKKNTTHLGGCSFWYSADKDSNRAVALDGGCRGDYQSPEKPSPRGKALERSDCHAGVRTGSQ